MSLPYIINYNEVDAESPVTDALMTGIKDDLDYLDASISASGGTAFTFNVNGPLRAASTFKGALDSNILYSSFTPTASRASMRLSGSGGKLSYDLRKMLFPRTPIIEIAHQYEGNTQSIARIAASISTQSIQRSIAQINTQSISFAKSQLSTQSIVNVGTNLWRYNFSGAALDADYQVGKYFLAAGHTAGGNNGTFLIVEVNQSGFPSLVVTNASGVAQTSAAGTVDLKLMSYNYTNPVNADYVANEDVLFAAHTSAANDGRFPIYKTNQAGNNIWVYSQNGVVQGGAAGTTDCERWIFAYSGLVSTTHYRINDNALMASHSSAANNGNKKIVDINRGGNNLIIYNSSGVVQGGAAGNASSNLWIYAQNIDPSSQVSITQSVSFENHTTPANNLIAAVVYVNNTGNDLVIYNEAGVAQAGVAGQARHTRKLVKFSADQSSIYTTDSYIEISENTLGTFNYSDYKAQYRVLEVNRGGGANYNVVIDGQNNQTIASPSGFIITEGKSLFSAIPEINISLTGLTPNRIINLTSSSFAAGSVAANQNVFLYLLEVPTGNPIDFSVTLS